MGILPGQRGYTLLFTRSAMGFVLTTKSKDLGLTSHPKDGGGGGGSHHTPATGGEERQS